MKLRKPGDKVFVIIKHTDTENSFVLDIRARILKSQFKLDHPKSKISWFVEDLYGDSKGSFHEEELFDTKEDAIKSILGGKE